MRESKPLAFRVLDVALVLTPVLVLAWLILPALLTRTTSLRTGPWCIHKLKQITMAIQTYAQDYGGYYPSHLEPDEQGLTTFADLGILYPTYITSLDLFTCPNSGDHMPERISEGEDNKPFLPDEAKNISYAYGLNKNAANKAWTTAAPATTRILADRHATRALTKKSNHKTDGRNIAFADGHVKWIPGGASLDSDPGNPDPNAHGTGPDWWSER